jgi:hypothetical protein
MGAKSSRAAAATYTIPPKEGLLPNRYSEANEALEENLAATKKSLEECLAKAQYVQAQLRQNSEPEMIIQGYNYPRGGKRRRRRTAKKRLSQRRKSHRRR